MKVCVCRSNCCLLKYLYLYTWALRIYALGFLCCVENTPFMSQTCSDTDLAVSSWERKAEIHENADHADTGLFACFQFLQETDVSLVWAQ